MYGAKYYVTIANRVGQAAFDASSMGCLVIGNAKSKLHNLICHEDCLMVGDFKVTDVTNLINKIESDDVYYNKLLSIQKRVNAKLETPFFKKIYPSKSIKTQIQFKEEIKKSIESQYDQQSDQKFLNDVMKKLVEELKFDLPKKFLIKWLQKKDEKEISIENATEQYEKSEKGLRYQLIEEEIIDKNNLKIDEKEIKSFAKNIFLSQFGQISKKDNDQEIEEMRRKEKELSNKSNHKSYLYSLKKI